jgi:hypothetical protein
MSDSDRDILRAIAVLIDEHEHQARDFRTSPDEIAVAVRKGLGDLYDEFLPAEPDLAEVQKIAENLTRPQRIALRQIAQRAPNYQGGFAPRNKIAEMTVKKLLGLDLLIFRIIEPGTEYEYVGYRPTRLGSAIAEVIEETLHQDLTDVQRAALRAIADKEGSYRSGIVPAGRHTGILHSVGRALDGLGLVRTHSFPHNGFKITEAGRRVLTRHTEYLLELSAEVAQVTGDLGDRIVQSLKEQQS